MAERAGFEPANHLRGYPLSRRVPSADSATSPLECRLIIAKDPPPFKAAWGLAYAPCFSIGASFHDTLGPEIGAIGNSIHL
jgi:hypothetical protein